MILDCLIQEAHKIAEKIVDKVGLLQPPPKEVDQFLVPPSVVLVLGWVASIGVFFWQQRSNVR